MEGTRLRFRAALGRGPRKSTIAPDSRLAALVEWSRELWHYENVSGDMQMSDRGPYPLIRSSRNSRPAKVTKFSARVQSSARESRSSESGIFPPELVPRWLSSTDL
jgi:hypothetical protein